ncbi:hypothetical protein STAFG_7893 [Streptomyces afghaniensis 772]|uniref:Uncharacterized protein n=1 Tax=Streptomyces afghaniensis 772 TaxID=1283301 RepID=S4MF27_9ACTN|nr:hypothetical protein STAFG_7893 [Streptomyces afghaniensis 772]
MRSSSGFGPRRAGALLDGCGQREDIGWAGKDADRPFGVVLDEPLPGRREDDGV